jgi:hypothetical protein
MTPTPPGEALAADGGLPGAEYPPTMLVRCWACARDSRAPIWEGVVTPIIKCHWCGALIEDIGDDGMPTLPAPTAARSRGHRALGVAMTLTVVTLVSLTAWIAITDVIPGALHVLGASAALLPLQLAATALATFILALYGILLLKHPGSVVLSAPADPSQVPPGGFNDWRLCGPCGAPKSPQAHHCRRCATCVDGMDHHCVFTGNRCVGAGNMAAFLRFLTALLVGCGVAIGVALIQICGIAQPIMAHTMATYSKFGNLGMLGKATFALTFTYRWILTAAPPLRAWALTLLVASTAGVGVGVLACRVGSARAAGTTILGQLQRRRREKAL